MTGVGGHGRLGYSPRAPRRQLGREGVVFCACVSNSFETRCDAENFLLRSEPEPAERCGREELHEDAVGFSVGCGAKHTSVSLVEPSATVRNPPENACGMRWAVRQAERKEHARKHCWARLIDPDW
jgi:hypothetical protein